MRISDWRSAVCSSGLSEIRPIRGDSGMGPESAVQRGVAQRRKRMMKSKFSRRQVLATSAATATALAMPFVRGAHAAGTISVGFWDHWVPGANDTLTKLCNEWAEKSKVEVKIDYITSQGSTRSEEQTSELQSLMRNSYAV